MSPGVALVATVRRRWFRVRIEPPFYELPECQRAVARKRLQAEALSLDLAFELKSETLCFGLRRCRCGLWHPATIHLLDLDVPLAVLLEDGGHGSNAPLRRSANAYV